MAFEGIDGSGKSSTMAHVVAQLQHDGLPVVATREETDTARGAWVRQSITERWPPLATTFLFAADRAAHVPDIDAWRNQGKHVLCDRFVHSTLAYQSVTLRGVVPDAPTFLRDLHAGWCPMPDQVLLFRADPIKCLERVHKRGAATPYEKARFLQEVQNAYLAQAKADPARFHVLDAERDLKVVAEDALRIVRGWLA